MANEREYRLAKSRITLGGRVLTDTQNAQTQVAFDDKIIDVTDVEQIEGIAESIEKAVVNTFTATFFNISPSNLRDKLFPNRFKSYTNGNRGNIHFGEKINYLTDYAEDCVIHDDGVEANNRAFDLKFRKVAAVFDGTQINWNKDTPQTIKVTFKIFPDRTAPAGEEYLCFGDWTVTANVALFVFVTSSPRSLDFDEGKHLTEYTIKEGARMRLFLTAGFGKKDVDETNIDITFDIDEGGGVLTTSTMFGFSNLTVANYLTEGMWIKMTPAGSHEWARVTAVNYATATSGTITVGEERALFDSPVKLAHADATTCEIYSQIGFQDASFAAAQSGLGWESTMPGIVAVGNIDGGAGDDIPGVTAHISAGSASITAAFGGKTSPGVTIIASSGP